MNVAIILAAGESSRLGRPKQLVDLGGEPLVCRAVRIAQEAGLVALVVLGAGADEVAAVLHSGVATVRNGSWSDGMGTSVVAGVRAAIDLGATTVTILPCDLPHVTGGHLARLRDSLGGYDVAAARYEGVLGAPAVFAAATFDDLLGLEPASGARELIRSGSLRVCAVPMPGAAIDVDTASDLEALRS